MRLGTFCHIFTTLGQGHFDIVLTLWASDIGSFLIKASDILPSLSTPVRVTFRRPSVKLGEGYFAIILSQ
jgi:hypothetical protein